MIKKENLNIFNGFLFVLGIIKAFYGIIFLIFGNNFVFGIVWFLLGIIDYIISTKFQNKKVINIVISCICALSLLLQGLIFVLGNDSNTENADYVLVLGYQLDHDTMEETLVNRLEKALEYANENKNTKLVLCGGITRENTVSEASLMKKWLIENGLNESRIILEDKSTTTIENIKNAKEYIDINSKVVVLSSNYHVFRAKQICKKCNINALGLGSKAPIVLIPNQLFSELIGLVSVITMK